MEEVKEYLVSGKLGFANGFLGDPKSNLVICQPHKRKDFKRITRK